METTGFDKLAHSYDRWYDSPSHKAIDRLEKEAVRCALGVGTGLLLDAGCGTGHWFSLLGECGYEVVGVDLSIPMLKVASEKFRGCYPLVNGDVTSLPFKDRCFNAVVSITTLEFVSDPVASISEMWRCLKPGGVLILGLLNSHSYLGVMRKLLRKSTFRHAHFFTPKEVRTLLESYGKAEVSTCAFVPPYDLLVPLANVIEGLGKRLFPMTGQLIVASVKK